MWHDGLSRTALPRAMRRMSKPAMSRRSTKIPWLALLALLAIACSRAPESGPVAIHWDRDVCARCKMVISDRHYAAEIRYTPPGKSSRVALFDDIGCAVQWLKDKPWRNDPKTEIWVADHRSGEWLDARKARYVRVPNTPMEYGLGAQRENTPGSLDFEQAKAHVAEVEKRFSSGAPSLERIGRPGEGGAQ